MSDRHSTGGGAVSGAGRSRVTWLLDDSQSNMDDASRSPRPRRKNRLAQATDLTDEPSNEDKAEEADWDVDELEEEEDAGKVIDDEDIDEASDEEGAGESSAKEQDMRSSGDEVEIGKATKPVKVGTGALRVQSMLQRAMNLAGHSRLPKASGLVRIPAVTQLVNVADNSILGTTAGQCWCFWRRRWPRNVSQP